jgi:hypothetical protein
VLNEFTIRNVKAEYPTRGGKMDLFKCIFVFGLQWRSGKKYAEKTKM